MDSTPQTLYYKNPSQNGEYKTPPAANGMQ